MIMRNSVTRTWPDSMVLRLRDPAPGNWGKAKCLGLDISADNDPFFDDDPEPAMEFCNGTADGKICPIRDQCLQFAIVNSCREGVWGGCDEATRKAIRRTWPMGRDGAVRPEWVWMDRETALAGARAKQSDTTG